LKPEVCKNCQSPLQGKFCSQCGQGVSANNRITFHSSLKVLLLTITDWDRGFLRTFADLAVDPGKMVSHYLEGQRTRYVSPFRFVLIPVLLFAIMPKLFSFQIDHQVWYPLAFIYMYILIILKVPELTTVILQ